MKTISETKFGEKGEVLSFIHFNKSKARRWMSVFIAFAFLFNVCSPSWARVGNYGDSDTEDAFWGGALSGLITDIFILATGGWSTIYSSGAGAIAGVSAYYNSYETYGETASLFGTDLECEDCLGIEGFDIRITKGELAAMTAAIIAGVVAGLATSAASAGKTAAKEASSAAVQEVTTTTVYEVIVGDIVQKFIVDWVTAFVSLAFTKGLTEMLQNEEVMGKNALDKTIAQVVAGAFGSVVGYYTNKAVNSLIGGITGLTMTRLGKAISKEKKRLLDRVADSGSVKVTVQQADGSSKEVKLKQLASAKDIGGGKFELKDGTVVVVKGGATAGNVINSIQAYKADAVAMQGVLKYRGDVARGATGLGRAFLSSIAEGLVLIAMDYDTYTGHRRDKRRDNATARALARAVGSFVGGAFIPGRGDDAMGYGSYFVKTLLESGTGYLADVWMANYIYEHNLGPQAAWGLQGVVFAAQGAVVGGVLDWAFRQKRSEDATKPSYRGSLLRVIGEDFNRMFVEAAMQVGLSATPRIAGYGGGDLSMRAQIGNVQKWIGRVTTMSKGVTYTQAVAMEAGQALTAQGRQSFVQSATYSVANLFLPEEQKQWVQFLPTHKAQEQKRELMEKERDKYAERTRAWAALPEDIREDLEKADKLRRDGKEGEAKALEAKVATRLEEFARTTGSKESRANLYEQMQDDKAGAAVLALQAEVAGASDKKKALENGLTELDSNVRERVMTRLGIKRNEKGEAQITDDNAGELENQSNAIVGEVASRMDGEVRGLAARMDQALLVYLAGEVGGRKGEKADKAFERAIGRLPENMQRRAREAVGKAGDPTISDAEAVVRGAEAIRGGVSEDVYSALSGAASELSHSRRKGKMAERALGGVLDTLPPEMRGHIEEALDGQGKSADQNRTEVFMGLLENSEELGEFAKKTASTQLDQGNLGIARELMGRVAKESSDRHETIEAFHGAFSAAQRHYAARTGESVAVDWRSTERGQRRELAQAKVSRLSQEVADLEAGMKGWEDRVGQAGDEVKERQAEVDKKKDELRQSQEGLAAAKAEYARYSTMLEGGQYEFSDAEVESFLRGEYSSLIKSAADMATRVYEGDKYTSKERKFTFTELDNGTARNAWIAQEMRPENIQEAKELMAKRELEATQISVGAREYRIERAQGEIEQAQQNLSGAQEYYQGYQKDMQEAQAKLDQAQAGLGSTQKEVAAVGASTRLPAGIQAVSGYELVAREFLPMATDASARVAELDVQMSDSRKLEGIMKWSAFLPFIGALTMTGSNVAYTRKHTGIDSWGSWEPVGMENILYGGMVDYHVQTIKPPDTTAITLDDGQRDFLLEFGEQKLRNEEWDEKKAKDWREAIREGKSPATAVELSEAEVGTLRSWSDGRTDQGGYQKANWAKAVDKDLVRRQASVLGVADQAALAGFGRTHAAWSSEKRDMFAKAAEGGTPQYEKKVYSSYVGSVRQPTETFATPTMATVSVGDIRRQLGSRVAQLPEGKDGISGLMELTREDIKVARDKKDEERVGRLQAQLDLLTFFKEKDVTEVPIHGGQMQLEAMTYYDTYGMATKTQTYGTGYDAASGEFETALRDMDIEHIQGPVGEALTVTSDYTQIRTPDAVFAPAPKIKTAEEELRGVIRIGDREVSEDVIRLPAADRSKRLAELRQRRADTAGRLAEALDTDSSYLNLDFKTAQELWGRESLDGEGKKQYDQLWGRRTELVDEIKSARAKIQTAKGDEKTELARTIANNSREIFQIQDQVEGLTGVEIQPFPTDQFLAEDHPMYEGRAAIERTAQGYITSNIDIMQSLIDSYDKGIADLETVESAVKARVPEVTAIAGAQRVPEAAAMPAASSVTGLSLGAGGRMRVQEQAVAPSEIPGISYIGPNESYGVNIRSLDAPDITKTLYSFSVSDIRSGRGLEPGAYLKVDNQYMSKLQGAGFAAFDNRVRDAFGLDTGERKGLAEGIDEKLKSEFDEEKTKRMMREFGKAMGKSWERTGSELATIARERDNVAIEHGDKGRELDRAQEAGDTEKVARLEPEVANLKKQYNALQGQLMDRASQLSSDRDSALRLVWIADSMAQREEEGTEGIKMMGRIMRVAEEYAAAETDVARESTLANSGTSILEGLDDQTRQSVVTYAAELSEREGREITVSEMLGDTVKWAAAAIEDSNAQKASQITADVFESINSASSFSEGLTGITQAQLESYVSAVGGDPAAHNFSDANERKEFTYRTFIRPNLDRAYGEAMAGVAPDKAAFGSTASDLSSTTMVQNIKGFDVGAFTDYLSAPVPQVIDIRSSEHVDTGGLWSGERVRALPTWRMTTGYTTPGDVSADSERFSVVRGYEYTPEGVKGIVDERIAFAQQSGMQARQDYWQSLDTGAAEGFAPPPDRAFVFEPGAREPRAVYRKETFIHNYGAINQILDNYSSGAGVSDTPLWTDEEKR